MIILDKGLPNRSSTQIDGLKDLGKEERSSLQQTVSQVGLYYQILAGTFSGLVDLPFSLSMISVKSVVYIEK